ncbi:MAG: hypothetical protein AB7U63_10270 [Porticoccaceae bacterium]
MNNTANKGRRLNWRQACEILGCKKDRFYVLVRSGALPGYRVQGSARGLWVYENDCRALVGCVFQSCPNSEAKP